MDVAEENLKLIYERGSLVMATAATAKVVSCVLLLSYCCQIFLVFFGDDVQVMIGQDHQSILLLP